MEKRGLVIFFVLVSILILIQPSFSQEPGLVAYYKLDGNARDRIGLNNGQIIGNPLSIEGKKCSAMQFDGIDDAIEIPDSEAISMQPPLTLMFWVKRSRINVYDYVFFKNGVTSGWGFGIAGNNNLHLPLYGVIGFWSGYFFGKITDTNWHHVALTIDADKNLKTYKDGVYITTIKVGQPIPTTNPLRIAANVDSYDRITSYIPISLDEVKFYNLVLTQDEIVQAYNSYIAPPTCADNDEDGYYAYDATNCPTGNDCNDCDNFIYPDNPNDYCNCNLGDGHDRTTEICDDRIDNDCDGKIDNLDSDCVAAYYKFELNGNDETNTHNLQIFGNPEFIDGKRASAIRFDGINDYAMTISSPYLVAQIPFTVAAWVKRDAINEDDVIISKKANGGWALTIASNNKIKFTFYGAKDYYSQSTITDTNWHHVAVTIDASKNIIFYLDGVNSGTAKMSATENPAPTIAPVMMGVIPYWFQLVNGYLDYSIDELRIYNRALSPTEISNLIATTSSCNANSECCEEKSQLTCQGKNLASETRTCNCVSGNCQLSKAYVNIESCTYGCCDVSCSIITPVINVLPSTTVDTGQEVYFDSSGTNINRNEKKFVWDFGDGLSSPSPLEGTAFTHAYTQPGTYEASLTISDGCGNTNKATATINVQGQVLPADFELLHADFHAHIAQYIYAQIPEQITSNPTNKIKATITGDNSYNKVLLEKTNLQSEEKFLLRNSELPAGNYILTAQLLDSTGKVIPGYEIKEKFSKSYAGIPKVGIDENNAIRINGKLFFPVTPFGLNDGSYTGWITQNKYINSLFAEGFSSTPYKGVHHLQSWQYYLDLILSYNAYMIGPNSWEGNKKAYSDMAKLSEYVTNTKSHSAMLAWSWDDEPDLSSKNIHPATVRAWTYKSHELDLEHPVVVNFAGLTWFTAARYETTGKRYSYLYNKNYFGKKTMIADILDFDYYSIDYYAPGCNWGWHARVRDIPYILNLIQKSTYNLIPVMNFVEVADVRDLEKGTSGQPPCVSPPPTGKQVKMLAWLGVVHGAKGINWFQFFGVILPDAYEAMTEFTNQITRLTPVVLSAEVERQVTDNADTNDIRRVDTMVREYDNKIYIFAVRVTEIEEHNAGTSIDVSFNVQGITNAIADVFDESRQLTITNGAFTDTFAPDDVHIYIIDAQGSLKGDLDSNGKVSLVELLRFIKQTILGNEAASDILQVINNWKQG